MEEREWSSVIWWEVRFLEGKQSLTNSPWRERSTNFLELGQLKLFLHMLYCSLLNSNLQHKFATHSAYCFGGVKREDMGQAFQALTRSEKIQTLGPELGVSLSQVAAETQTEVRLTWKLMEETPTLAKGCIYFQDLVLIN